MLDLTLNSGDFGKVVVFPFNPGILMLILGLMFVVLPFFVFISGDFQSTSQKMLVSLF